MFSMLLVASLVFLGCITFRADEVVGETGAALAGSALISNQGVTLGSTCILTAALSPQITSNPQNLCLAEERRWFDALRTISMLSAYGAMLDSLATAEDVDAAEDIGSLVSGVAAIDWVDLGTDTKKVLETEAIPQAAAMLYRWVSASKRKDAIEDLVLSMDPLLKDIGDVLGGALTKEIELLDAIDRQLRARLAVSGGEARLADAASLEAIARRRVALVQTRTSLRAFIKGHAALAQAKKEKRKDKDASKMVKEAIKDEMAKQVNLIRPPSVGVDGDGATNKPKSETKPEPQEGEEAQ